MTPWKASRRCLAGPSPLFGKRTFNIRITPAAASAGSNRLLGHDEFVTAEIGQTGTQFDGLGHIGLQMGNEGDQKEMRFYNGNTEFDMIDAYGLKKLGIENCKPIFTRGHLFDIEGVKGREAEFPMGLKGQPSYLTDEIAGPIHVATDLGKIVTGVPLPRPRPYPPQQLASN